MNTEKKVRLELTAKELETIYSAMNSLCCHYAEKSESLKKITEAVKSGNTGTWIEPDYYQQLWENAGHIQSKIYRAEKRAKRN